MTGPIRTRTRILLSCKDCRALFDIVMMMPTPVTELYETMTTTTCPECGSNALLMGQDRTLEEDRRFHSEGTIEERASAWIENGEIGASSRAIHAHMLDFAGAEMSAPRDASDLRRCVLLLTRIPEWVPRMGEMSAYPQWAIMAPRWADLVTTWIAEVGEGFDRVPAPRTRSLIAELTSIA